MRFQLQKHVEGDFVLVGTDDDGQSTEVVLAGPTLLQFPDSLIGSIPEGMVVVTTEGRGAIITWIAVEEA
ncbi:MAG TPA: hypothetical protein VLH56_19105 [Dissulfurispiraceae bacterium]|nr:hypothetical protein [Dissulfurispiraceae bacterium]